MSRKIKWSYAGGEWHQVPDTSRAWPPDQEKMHCEDAFKAFAEFVEEERQAAVARKQKQSREGQ
ncbi:hypothetical protein SAMN05216548_108176 [Faunimonas pinastri]|uniref:Uncharacterized protein n=1 Tax=Faunimonas pinastri TaxID=1855383 RepID=A0A1H9JLX3_9HYPH|nr:hypothetical protein [Faunimonas pinastri]SEQ87779.1 hypothetical protein SAMN05216548_108176 [Faunimonas pinastri]